MELKSLGFEPNGMIPRKYARDGEDQSPPLAWSDLPDETKSLALVVEDPDAPKGTFTHWVMWDIPVTKPTGKEGMPEGVSHSGGFLDGRRQGDNDFGERGYSGPMPPQGECHRYVFRLFALDDRLSLDAGATKRELLKAMEGHVLDQAEVVGRYERRA